MKLLEKEDGSMLEALMRRYDLKPSDAGRLLVEIDRQAALIAHRKTPDDRTRNMPDEIVAWPADVTPAGSFALTGAWSARRHYTDEAVAYVRKDKSN
jgi:hypothetical protein